MAKKTKSRRLAPKEQVKKSSKAKKKSEGKKQSRRKTLSLLPMHDIVAFPGTSFPLYTNRHFDVAAVDYALQNDRYIVLSLYTGSAVNHPDKDTLCRTAAVAEITAAVRLTSGDWKIRLHVLGRLKIISFVSQKPFIKVVVEYLDERTDYRLTSAQEELVEDVKSKFEVLSQFDEALEDHGFAVRETFDPGFLGDIVAMALPLEIEESKELLKELNPFKRLKRVDELLTSQLDAAEIRERISAKVDDELARTEQEQLLREQLRQIQAELGEGADAEEDIGELKKQLENSALPAVVKKVATKQIRRLQLLHPDTSEAALARTYLDWIMDLPWAKRTKDRYDIKAAKAELDRNHYGLKETKERVLDFLGVRKLKKNLRGPILLLVGPPGTGKTSLGRAIAEALGRKFVRMSVGGLRDEAELRGHRKTYVGAMPGKIIQGLKKAGSKNPVFVLDEVDKIGSDFRGDPASVLLEVLDPEQNKIFEDHYLNLPFDLSEVMFVATANVTDTIPSALLDRMEVIEVSGYTNEEKLAIAKRHLVPREKNENGLDKYPLDITDDSLLHIITGYTRESGVRNLRRTISAVFRKTARAIAEGQQAPKEIDPELVEKYLGPVKFVPESRLRSDQLGVVTGLAWTSVGGETMLIEAAVTKGKGKLLLTGQMGSVMQESAQAALTYVLSRAEQLGIDPDFYERSTVHVHVPEGATPKDGPSAGIAICTALVSILTGMPVSRNVAMTGEITLRGNVIGIGGLREKALAALRIGIPLLVIPKENERELVKFPKYLMEKVTFVAVESIEEVLKVALLDRKPEKDKSRSTIFKSVRFR